VFASKLAELLEIEQLIHDGQLIHDAEARQLVEKLKSERKEVRATLKVGGMLSDSAHILRLPSVVHFASVARRTTESNAADCAFDSSRLSLY